MRKSKLLTLGILAVILTLALSSLQAISVAAQQPEIVIQNVYWGSSGSTLQPEAGDKNVDLSVVIINTDTVTLQKVTAKLELKGTPFTSVTGETEATAGYGSDLLPGQSATLQFTLNIDENAALRDYKINMEITTQTTRYSTGVTVTADVMIPLRGKVSFSIQSEPEIINPAANAFTLKVTNTGDTAASSVDISVTATSPLTIIEDSYWVFKTISPSETVSMEMKVFAPTTTIGLSYPISLSLSYKDAYGFSGSISRSVGLTVENKVSPGEIAITRVGWTSLESPVGVSPGDEGATLLVEIQNLSNNTITGVDTDLQLAPPFTNITGGSSAVAYSSSINPSQTTTLQFKLNVSPQAELKDHPMNMTLTYFIKNSLVTPNEYINALPVELKFTVSLYGRSILKVDVEGSELTAGITDTLKIKIANSGTARVHNLEATLSLPSSTSTLAASTITSPLVFESADNYWHFNSVEAGRSVSFTSQILTAKDIVGNYQLNLALSYKDEWGISHTETRTLGVSVSPTSPSSLINLESYSFEPDPVYQGDTFNINIKLKNLGDFTAQTATAQLLVPTSFTAVSSSTVSLGNLLPSSGAAVDYIVLASPEVEAGAIHTFTVNIQYTDSLGVRQTGQNHIGVPIHGTIELIVYDINIEPSPVSVGGEFTATLTVLNKGTVTAMYTEASLDQEAPLTSTDTAVSYLGDVDPNAPLPISLKATVKPDAEEGTYPLKVKIAYQDEYRKPQIFVIDIPLEVSTSIAPPPTQSSPSSPLQAFGMELPLELIIVIIVIVVVIAAVVAIKKKRSSQDFYPEKRQ